MASKPSNEKRCSTVRDYIVIGVLIIFGILILTLFMEVKAVNNKIDARVQEREDGEAIEGKVYFTEKNLFFNEGEAECNAFCSNNKCATEEYDGYDGKFSLNDRSCSCQCYKLVK